MDNRVLGRAVLLLAAVLGLALAARALAQDSNRAALVIDYGEGHVESLCVEFTETEISGLELVIRSGLAFIPQADSLGALICSIEGVGCPADDCFCQCSGANCVYWSYWRMVAGEWTYSQVGADLAVIGDGDVEGWVWGPGAVNEAPPPPQLAFADICQQVGTVPITATPILLTPQATGQTSAPATAAPTATSTVAVATATPAAPISATVTQMATLESVLVTAAPASEEGTSAEDTGSPPAIIPAPATATRFQATVASGQLASQPPPATETPMLASEELSPALAPAVVATPTVVSPLATGATPSGQAVAVAIQQKEVPEPAVTIIGAGPLPSRPATDLAGEGESTPGEAGAALGYVLFAVVAVGLGVLILGARRNQG